MTNKVIFITGPTASGKSSLALGLAKKIDSEIISCDSQQIYKDMDIGTNKIREFEMDGISHYMIDFLSPKDEYSVQDFSNQARDLIKIINKNGKIPIVTGGTGLYIDSLLFAMNYGKAPKDEAIRKKYEKIKDSRGNIYLHSLLKDIDEKSAEKYHYNESKRIIRALEIYELTGKRPSEIRKGYAKENPAIDPILYFINYKDRDLLYDKINKRVVKMFEEGLYDEFIHLIGKYDLDENKQSMSAIGYKELFNIYYGKSSKEETIDLIQRNTRRYAKRQITWMKKYLDYNFTRYIEIDNIEKNEIINYMYGEILKKYDL